MLRPLAHLPALAALVTIPLVACERAPAPDAPPAPAPTTTSDAPPGLVTAAEKQLFAPLPARYDSAERPLTDEKVALGRMLFFDARLSKNHDVSCNSCHGLDTYGVDGKPTSTGHKAQRGARNAPTVYNAGAQVAQFWDGRAKDLEEQAKGPVLNPVEMAMPDDQQVVATLRSMPGYVEAFAKAFPDAGADAVTFERMAQAIGAFERTLVTPSRFDAFLQGDADALSDDEQRGMKTFIASGCVSCHAGAHLGGAMYQKAGVVTPWPNQADRGRFDLTQRDADLMMFKVPTLRNIAKTGPYFHDGSVATLDEAVRMMAKHQLGKSLTDDEARAIVTFLEALTGELPADTSAPKLPASTKDTPAPSAS